MSVLTGNTSVEAPFVDAPQDTEGDADTEACVQWYRTLQANDLHEPLEPFAGHVFGDLEREMMTKHMVLPWARELENTMMRLKSMPPESAWALHLKKQAALLEHLDQKGCFRGPQAFFASLEFKAGSIEEARRLFDAAGEGVGMSLMEMAGTLALLGIDPELVCGLGEPALFKLGCAVGSKALRIQDLEEWRQKPLSIMKRKLAAKAAAEAADAEAEAASDAQGGSGVEQRISLEEREAAQFKWVRIARWMAIAALRKAALSEERFQHGWRVLPSGAIGAAPATGSSPGDPGSNLAAEAATAGDSPEGSESRLGARSPPGSAGVGRGAPKSGPSWTPSMSSSRPRSTMLSSAAVMREQERTLKVFFAACSSSKLQDGTELLGSQDWRLFCSDLLVADPLRKPAAGDRGFARPFESAMALQKARGGPERGLEFWAFKVALCSLNREIGLSWQRTLAHIFCASASDRAAEEAHENEVGEDSVR